jgi:hypothetical protein
VSGQRLRRLRRAERDVASDHHCRSDPTSAWHDADPGQYRAAARLGRSIRPPFRGRSCCPAFGTTSRWSVGAAAARALTCAGPVGCQYLNLLARLVIYQQVLPGVDLDLEVTAEYAYFIEVLVVRNRHAGLRLLVAQPYLQIISPGLTIRPGPGDGLVGVDQHGHVAFTAPAASMWIAARRTHWTVASAPRSCG